MTSIAAVSVKCKQSIVLETIHFQERTNVGLQILAQTLSLYHSKVST